MTTKSDSQPSPYALPFVVAVAGHRDMHPDDVAAVQAQIRAVIDLIVSALPHSPIHFLSALADGADQLFAEQVLNVARSMRESGQGDPERIKLVVPLPLAMNKYSLEQAGGLKEEAGDPLVFQSKYDAFRQRFSALVTSASNCFVIPSRQLDREVSAIANKPDVPYARLARYLNTHAHLIVAVWDGQTEPADRFPRRAGGTLDAVLARLDGFDRIRADRSARRFAEREKGAAIHIYTRRERSSSDSLPAAAATPSGFCLVSQVTDGANNTRNIVPINGPGQQWLGLRKPSARDWIRAPVRACEAFNDHRDWRKLIERTEHRIGRKLNSRALAVLHRVWATGSEIDTLNRVHQQALRARVFAKTDSYPEQLKASAKYFADSLSRDQRKLGENHEPNSERRLQQLKDALTPQLHAYSVADVLAKRAKESWGWRWLFIAAGAVLASGASSLKVIDPQHGTLIETIALAAGVGIAAVTYLLVTLSRQRNAYLEYRALAEGLRFQMYWLAAGEPLLVTDHYVQKFRSELGWIRRALDALMVVPPVPRISAVSVAGGWIHDQLSYLNGHENRRRALQNARAVAVGNNLVLLGAVLAVAGAIFSSTLSGAYASVMPFLVSGMKLAPAIGAAWLSFNSKMARSETLKQVEHLKGIYARARVALDAIENSSDTVKRKEDRALDLLFALGKEALAENATWLSMYQQRKITWHGR